MATQEYFNKRFEALAQKYYRQGDATEPQLRRIFANANKDMRMKIDAFYAKYGTVQGAPVITTLADGSQVTTKSAPKLVVPVSEANKYNRLVKLEAQLNETLKQMAREQNTYMGATLKPIAEGAYYETLFTTYQGFGIGQSFTLLSPDVIKALTLNPVMGQDFSTRIWNNRRMLANVVNQELRNGIIQGVGNKEVAKRVSNRMNSGYKAAVRLVQTEITNTYAQANLLGYKEDGIEKYIYDATLDGRTSEVCRSLDQKVFKVSDATVGLNYPPMHPNCRSSTGAYFGKAEGTRRARDGKNTYTVPATMNYNDWKAIYVDKTMTRGEWNKMQ